MRHPGTSRALAVVFSIFLVALWLPACGKKSVRSDNLNEVAEATVAPTETPNGDLILAEFQDNPDVVASSPAASTVASSPAPDPDPTATPIPPDFDHVPDTVMMEPDPKKEEAKLKKKILKLKTPDVAETAPVSDPIPATDEPEPVVAEAVAVPTTPPAAIKVDTTNIDPDMRGGTRVSWLWWFLLILIAAITGWYFWDKRKNEDIHGLSGSPLRPAPPLGGLSPVSGYYAKGKTRARTRSTPKKKR